MKIRIHENGWTGIVEDVDFAKITQEEVNQLGRFLATNTLIVGHNQGHLTVEDHLRLAKMFGEAKDRTHQAQTEPYKSWQIPGSNNTIMRVTGELDEHGQPGLFGHVSDLDWHCNGPAEPNRKPLVWLLGIKGTAGSKTTWNNNILSYRDLDPEFKEQIKDLKMVCGFKRGAYSEINFGKDEDYNEHYNPSLVHVNSFGLTGLFAPILQFRNFVGMTQEESLVIINKLRDHILQDKYCYHHDWTDGDVVLAEQWFGIHKRWKFDGMPNRVLWRMEWDFANIDLSGLGPDSQFGDLDDTVIVR